MFWAKRPGSDAGLSTIVWIEAVIELDRVVTRKT
jgi:hypothetical protein